MSGRDPNETPEWVEVVEEIIEDRLYEVNTAFPGTIRALNKSMGLVDVQPDFKTVMEDGTVKDPPTIKGLVLWQYRAGTARINMPVKIGHKVLVVCSQRSLERWKRTGTLDRPGSSRIHSKSDGVAIPGMYPTSEAFPIGDNFTLEFGSAIISLLEDDEISARVKNAIVRLTQDGKISLSNGTVEVIDMVIKGLQEQNATIDLILALTVPTSLGPSGTPINATAFQTQKQKNQKLIDSLMKLKR